MRVELGRERVAAAYDVIKPYIRVTPVVEVDGSDFGLAPFRLTLKLEQLQHAGSFKTRGAFTHWLTRTVPAAGVVAASGGNHGAAVAYVAKRMGGRAKIFVPKVSSPAKVARIRSYGADLEIVGDRYAEALAASEEWAVSSGALQIHAFDQIETLLGQATLALELERQTPNLDTILVAVGGGGLLGGIAAWHAGGDLEERSKVRILGVEPEAAPTLFMAFAAGRPVDAPAGGIAADSLAPLQVGQLMFPLAQEAVERAVLVSDDAIRAAQEALWNGLRIAVEPGGAAAFASLLCGAYQPAPDEHVAVIISGGNTTAVQFT